MRAMLEQFPPVCFGPKHPVLSSVLPLGFTKVTRCIMGTSAEDGGWRWFYVVSVCVGLEVRGTFLHGLKGLKERYCLYDPLL